MAKEPIKTKNLFLTGKPGSGKTTLLREVCLPFMEKLGGFYTEELREEKERLGFRIKTFDGKDGIFAKKGMESEHKLDKYGVDLKVLEELGVGAMRRAMAEKSIIVIDEIGSMEVLSGEFMAALFECLNSDKKVLATIRFNSQPFTDEVKKMDNTSLVEVSRDNYIGVKRRIREWLSNS